MDFHPPEALLGKIVILRRYRMTDTAAVKDAIAVSLESLQKWMPWAQSAPTDQSVMSFLGPAVAQFGGDAAANYAITLRENGDYIGGCSLIPRIGPGALEVGYWVHYRVSAPWHRTNPRDLSPMRRSSFPASIGSRSIATSAMSRVRMSRELLGFRLDRIKPGPTELVQTGRIR